MEHLLLLLASVQFINNTLIMQLWSDVGLQPEIMTHTHSALSNS